jgi:1D-myo-inositol-tetrakisphosphate 5-kinase/inositol-polyphosphate multikinase
MSEKIELSLENCFPSKFDYQVAGHTNEMVRRFGPHCIIKPQNKPDLFAREVQFYQEIFEGVQPAPSFFPHFYGLVEVEDEFNDKESHGIIRKRPCIILQDMTLSYLQPSMIDIKIGRQTYEPTASTAKVERELRKYPYQNDIGFRITGMKVWNCSEKNYFFVDKWFGRSLLPVHVPLGLAAYFFDGVSFRVQVMRDTIKQLRKVLQWMGEQKRYKFFCSSILVVYDSEESDEPKRSDEKQLSCRVSMIDFAHVCVNSSDSVDVDEGYIFGVSNLIGYVEYLVTISEQPEQCRAFINDMRQLLLSWTQK